MLGQFLSGEILRIPVFMHLPHLVRTGNHAVPAAHAFGFIDPDNAVFSLLSGTGGTNFNAFRFGAMITAYGINQLGYRRIFAFLTDEHSVPEYLGREEMFRFAGKDAGITADASFQLYCHSPSPSFLPPTPSYSILWSILYTLTMVAVSWLQHTGQACLASDSSRILKLVPLP